MQYTDIAWRNIWRNKKRTFITVSAIVMAVMLSTLFSSVQEGTYSSMIKNFVGFYSGYIQIHDTNYWDSRSINDTYEYQSEISKNVEAVDGVSHAVPRLESFTLVSTGNNTRGCALIGIDPIKEDKLTEMSQWIRDGEYLKEGDDGIILSANTAMQIKANIGDTLVLISQGYHGASAAGLFPLRGILEYPSPEMNNMGGFVTLEKAQEFFSAYDRITSLVVMLDNHKKMKLVQNSLINAFPEYKVMNWEEMNPELVQMIESDQTFAIIFKLIIYLIVGFGIFGTVIMMIQERHRENAVIVAVGMQKIKLQLILIIETLFLGVVGLLVGFGISMPIIGYFKNNPIFLGDEYSQAMESYGMEAAIYFAFDFPVFFVQVLIVFIITTLVAFYPFFKVMSMNVIKNMRE